MSGVGTGPADDRGREQAGHLPSDPEPAAGAPAATPRERVERLVREAYAYMRHDPPDHHTALARLNEAPSLLPEDAETRADGAGLWRQNGRRQPRDRGSAMIRRAHI